MNSPQRSQTRMLTTASRVTMRFAGRQARWSSPSLRRLGAYIEDKGKRPDPITFMRENGGVETSNRDDSGLFFGLLAKAGFA